MLLYKGIAMGLSLQGLYKKTESKHEKNAATIVTKTENNF